MTAVTHVSPERVVARLPTANDLEIAEERVVAIASRIVDKLTRTRAAAILGRTESWLGRALHPNREQRHRMGCSLSARDLLVLLATENALGESELLDELAHAALGEDVDADDLAEAWDEVGREHLGQVFEGLRHRVLARARSKRVKRAPMRARRSGGPTEL